MAVFLKHIETPLEHNARNGDPRGVKLMDAGRLVFTEVGKWLWKAVWEVFSLFPFVSFVLFLFCFFASFFFASFFEDRVGLKYCTLNQETGH